MDGDWAFPNKGYNKSWKQHRKLFTQHINPTAVRDVFSRIQIYAIHALLRNLISDPAHFEQHILHSSASIILGVAYGYEVRPQNDPLVKLAELTSRQVTEGLHPKYLVNVLPECRLLFCESFPLTDSFCCSDLHPLVVPRRRIQDICGERIKYS